MKKILIKTGKVILIILGIILAFLILGYLFTSGNYEVAKTVEHDPSIPHIKIGTTTFHAESFGSDTNETVVVVHGGPGQDYRYLLSLKALSDEYHVVFYDQRGTGLSPRVPADQHSLETSLEDLHDIILYFGKGDRVNIIGHSWGGMLASAYLGMHPELIHKAILAEPGMLTAEKAQEFQEIFKIPLSLAALYHFTRAWFESQHIKGPDDQAKFDYFFSRIATTYLKGNPLAGYFCDNKLENASMDIWRLSMVASQYIMKAGLEEMANSQINLVEGVGNFHNKVLFIAGECNQLIGQEYQAGHMKYFPDAEMVVIENAGHTMFGEQPEASMKVIRRYFSE